MQRRALIMLVVALVLGIITVVLVSGFLKRESGDSGRMQRLHTVPVVVAALDLKIGTKLEKVMLQQMDLPEKGLPAGYYVDPAAVLGTSAPVVLREIRRGEVVLAYKLSPQGARGGLPSKILEDKRAITIPVTEITGVAGFVTPGDYVDVLHTSVIKQSDGVPVVRVLQQNMLVLGTDQVMSEDGGNPKIVNAVTLMTDVETSQRITLALATGTLSLLLRNEFDGNLLDTADMTWSDLAGGAPPLVEDNKTRVIKRERRQPRVVIVPLVSAPSAPQVEVVRGLQVTQQTVPGAPASKDSKATPAAGTK
jgi:pilus assembly protein CpaB